MCCYRSAKREVRGCILGASIDSWLAVNLNEWNDFSARGEACFSDWDGNFWNGNDIKYHCASAQLGKSEASAHIVPRPQSTTSGWSGRIQSAGGRKQAYAAEQLPPLATEKTHNALRTSHCDKRRGWRWFPWRGRWRWRQLEIRDTTCWCVSAYTLKCAVTWAAAHIEPPVDTSSNKPTDAEWA